MALQGIQWSEEQLEILDSCPVPAEDGIRFRITAAAGTGKTTTLQALAVRAAQHCQHKRITYLTFNRKTALEGKEKMSRALSGVSVSLQARTIHSVAKEAVDEFLKVSPKSLYIPLSDADLDQTIEAICCDQITDFVQIAFLNIDAQLSGFRMGYHPRETKRENLKRRARKQVVIFIRKTFEDFCRSDEVEFQDDRRLLYLIRNFHEDNGENARCTKLGFNPDRYCGKRLRFYNRCTIKLRDHMEAKKSRSYDFDVKLAQLKHLLLPDAPSLLLIDESQDMDACQISWLTDQVMYGAHIYLVGDAAQTIYGFRGARSLNLMNVKVSKDFFLTESWRFGQKIARIANCILFAKENTLNDRKNRKHWEPYRVRATMSKDGSVAAESILPCWKSIKPLTIISRRNDTLLQVSLRLLRSEAKFKGGDGPPSVTFPKFHINTAGESSGRNKFEKILRQVEAVFNLFCVRPYERMLPPTLFPEFPGDISWEDFLRDIEANDLRDYAAVAMLVAELEYDTLEAVDLFKEMVLDKEFRQDEADIILTTCHTAKGMEWDKVYVCDDFVELNLFKKVGQSSWVFNYKPHIDDLNMLYVACTRAKETLSVSQHVSEMVQYFDLVHWAIRECIDPKTIRFGTADSRFLLYKSEGTSKIGKTQGTSLEVDNQEGRKRKRSDTPSNTESPFASTEALGAFHTSLVLKLRNEQDLDDPSQRLADVLFDPFSL